MTAALRNLSVQSLHRQAFLEGGTMNCFAFLLAAYQSDQELILNISRILSKLTLHSDCRDALQRNKGVVENLAALSAMHRDNKPLAIRLLFILGNLTANDEENRHLLFHGTHAAQALFELLAYFVQIDSQVCV
jgi:hypothetical protein